MALENENGGGGLPATMLVGPATFGNNAMPYYPMPMMMGGGGGGGMSNGWGDGAWIILLIIVLLAAGGGWGNNNAGGGGFGNTPIIVNDGNGGSVQRGFDQAAVMAGLNGIQSGIYNLSTQLCNCCGDMQMAVANGFSQAEIANNARQIADMQQNFAAQMATMQGFNSIQSQLAQCCCDNRQATSDLRYTIATEECATRNNSTQNTRDIIESQTRGIQTIMDKLCALELDGYKRENDSLRSQLTAANLAASQIAQTAQIVDQTYNRLSTCPVGTVPVYGEQPIFRCNNNNGCGCGCGGNNF